MAKATVSANVSAADTKRIQASGFEDMAKRLRKKVRREHGVAAEVFRQVALYIEAEAMAYRLDADTLDHL
jgi:hypothetical protein